MKNIYALQIGLSLAEMDLSWMKRMPVHNKYSKPPTFNRLSQKGRRRRLRQELSR
ncbi:MULTISPECIES: hypothetical protein [unclassified Methylophaga]|jgi:predicted benzoate:H+ symporter BenE|uniref:hypothetical protein n=1 Tax=unclassified Methylophaga TaxID=2629249 RepID=UPI0025E21826|nr:MULTISPECIES: hypothetical protein [unclassified Methylophaga]